MTDRRYTDPLRRITDIKEGAGSDLLTLECGHRQSRDHRSKWGKSTRCFGCRVWKVGLQPLGDRRNDAGPDGESQSAQPLSTRSGSAC